MQNNEKVRRMHFFSNFVEQKKRKIDKERTRSFDSFHMLSRNFCRINQKWRKKVIRCILWFHEIFAGRNIKENWRGRRFKIFAKKPQCRLLVVSVFKKYSCNELREVQNKIVIWTISRKKKWWYGKSYNCPWASLAYSVNTRSPLESTNPNPPWVCPFGANSSLISNDFEFSLVKYCEKKNETE